MIYACSDIHGQYDYFIDVLDKINFSDDDYMYIIGDVIDRGPSSIKLLKFIMDMDNVKMMIGNHEDMMIRSLLFHDDIEFANWMNNGGDKTYEEFVKLDVDEQEEILHFLYKSPVLIANLNVDDNNFYLVHACHLNNYVDGEILYCDLYEEEIKKCVWDRDYGYLDKEMNYSIYRELYREYPRETKMLIGHTPVYFTNYGKITHEGRPMISRSMGGHLFNLDCGCASGLPLGCIRLNDFKEFYADIPNGYHINK